MSYSALKQIHKCSSNYVRYFAAVGDQAKTAGIIVVGDEILKGETADTNSFYMSSKLYKIGVNVKKISVIGDCVQEISDEVKGFSRTYNYVITTGGIGPTHDDVTFEAVAKAFDEPLFPHPELLKICTNFYKTNDPKSPGMKLCWVPESSKLTYGEDKKRGVKARYPNVSVRNVYMFPGIPQLLEGSFDLLCTTLFESKAQFYQKIVYLNVPECTIVTLLDTLVKDFPDVVFGSYPKLFNTTYKVKITIVSTVEKSAVKAYDEFLRMAPKNSIVSSPDPEVGNRKTNHDSDYKITDDKPPN